MPRFSIKDLMLATTLVALGLAIAIVDMSVTNRDLSRDYHLPLHPLTSLVVLSIGGAFIGAGLLAPFRRKAIGAGVGFFLPGLLIVGYILLVAR
jgi:hypothetical protein